MPISNLSEPALARLWWAWSRNVKGISWDALAGDDGVQHLAERLRRPLDFEQIVMDWRQEVADLPDGVRLMHREHHNYPKRLKHWEERPWFIYMQGHLSPRQHIAMVGAREADGEGIRVASELAMDLARHVEVISGGARGIDAACHRGAIQTGRTTVVLPGGLDRPSPQSNRALFAQIQRRGGALLSAVPLRQTVRKYHFARRNALLVALSDAVVIVRAEATGGTMLTAKLAQEQGVKLFAVPGSPHDLCSLGSLGLLRDKKAELAWSASHILGCEPEQLVLQGPEAPSSRILDWLRKENRVLFRTDELPEGIWDYAELLELELEGAIESTDQYDVWRVCRRR